MKTLKEYGGIPIVIALSLLSTYQLAKYGEPASMWFWSLWR